MFLKWTDFGILQRISPTSLSNSFKETPPENLPEFDDKFKILSSIIGGNKEICLPLNSMLLQLKFDHIVKQKVNKYVLCMDQHAHHARPAKALRTFSIVHFNSICKYVLASSCMDWIALYITNRTNFMRFFKVCIVVKPNFKVCVFLPWI